MAKAPQQTNTIAGTNRDNSSNGDAGSGGWRARLGQVFAPRRPVADINTLNGKRGAITSNGTGKSPITQTVDEKRSPWDIRPKSQLGKLVFGMLIYFLGSQLLEVGLAFVFNWLKVSVSARQTLFPANTWLVGGLSNFSLIYFLLIALFVWLLFRFNIIPRDFLRPASQQRGTTRGQSASQTSANGTSASTSTGSSSASRHSGRQRLTMTAPTTKSKRTPASTLRTRSTSTTAKPAAARASGKAPVPPPADESYVRVKAQQRARRRKR